MSALPLGERPPIEVTFRELDGKMFVVRRLNARMMQAYQKHQADPENLDLLMACVQEMLPGITDDEVRLLEMDRKDASVMKVIWLATAELDEVMNALKAAGAATPPPLNSTMT